MRYFAVIIGALVGMSCPALSDDQAPKTAASGPQEARASVPSRPEDEKAIRAGAEEFTRAYNAGDAHALAGQYTQDAELIDEDGGRYEGRDTIEQVFAAEFKASPGARITVTIDALRFLGPDVAKEEGRTTVTPPRGGAPVLHRYTVLHVKKDGQWLQDSVREEVEPGVRPHDRLKELEWMVGEWIDEGSDSVVKTACRWSEDGNFLLRTIKVQARGEVALTVSQRIGWDPLTRQFKSWEFDSEGGYGQGLWTQDGATWVVKHTGVAPDGSTGSSTRVSVVETPNRVRWKEFDRVVGGAVVSEDRSYVMVRVPPPPGGPAGKKPAPTSTKDQP